jgi:phenylalanyl-tRNA synthetase alpha chain
MPMRVEEISTWVQDARKAFASATDLDSLKTARLAHAGDKSPIALASRGLGALTPEDKASFGKVIGEAKAEIAQALAEATAVLEAERDRKVLLEEVVDITLPVNRSHRGGLHPISIIKNEVSDFFIEQGFAVEEGPELESGWLNFDALNIPADHPARTMQDTYFMNLEWFCVRIPRQFRSEPCLRKSHQFMLCALVAPFVQMNLMQHIALYSTKSKV